MIREILSWVFALVVVLYVLPQVRKPSRWTGRLFTWIMNRTHSRLTDWGLTHVTVGEGSTILDVGCGGGRTLQKLARLAPQGAVVGIDYARGSVEASIAINKALITAGRVEVIPASVSALPFPDEKFDLVSAVETHYYWPDLSRDTREILRVLRPRGTLLLIAESYSKGRRVDLLRPIMRLLRAVHLNVKEHRELFSHAGFTDIQVFEEPNQGWICVLGTKPVGSAPQPGSSCAPEPLALSHVAPQQILTTNASLQAASRVKE